MNVFTNRFNFRLLCNFNDTRIITRRGYFFTLWDYFTARFNSRHESERDYIYDFFSFDKCLCWDTVSSLYRIFFPNRLLLSRNRQVYNGGGGGGGKSALTLRAPIMRERAISKHSLLTPLESIVAPMLAWILASLAALLIFPKCVSIPIQSGDYPRYSFEDCERVLGLSTIALARW